MPSIQIEDPIKLVDLSQIVGGFATFLGVIIAIIAGLITYFQIKSNRSTQREATAKDIYKQYLLLAFENPKFAYCKKYPFNSHLETEKYEWFVSHLLWGCSEIMDYAEGNEWNSTISDQLSYHVPYLRHENFRSGPFLHYSSHFRNLIEEACNKAAQDNGENKN